MLKYHRFTDRNNIRKHHRDFLPRHYGVHPVMMLASIILGAIFIVITCHLFVREALLVIIPMVSLVFTALMITVVFNMQRLNDVIMATEFQNAMFAGVMRLDAQFCIIIKRDGTLMYADEGFHKHFLSIAGEEDNLFSALLEKAGLTEVEIEDYKRMFKNGQSFSLPISLTHQQGQVQQFNLAFEAFDATIAHEMERSESPEQVRAEKHYTVAGSALQRPHGFYVIRALHKKHTETSEDYWMTYSNVPIFGIAEDGTLQYVNHAFTRCLGHHANSLYNIPLTTVIPNDFSLPSLRQDVTNFSYSLLKYTDYKGVIKDAWCMPITLQSEQDMPLRFYLMLPLPFGHIAPSAVTSHTANPSAGPMLEVLETSAIPSVVVNAQLRVVWSNSAFDTLIGKTALASLSFEFPSVIQPSQMQAVTQLLSAKLQEKLPMASADTVPQEFTLSVDHNGSAPVVLMYVSKIATRANEEQGLLLQLSDISEHKNLELRYTHSQKMQAVGQLAGGIAHDFNNLLTAMMGFCDLLLIRHHAGDPSFADIMQIKQNTNRAANLVRQLLAFSRKQTLQTEILELSNVIAEVSHLIRRLIGVNITLEVQHGQDLHRIRADQGQLEQVLMNLAVNARDAMKSAGGTLTIQTKNITIKEGEVLAEGMVAPAGEEAIQPGEYVLLEITDTGHGMAPELLTKIFEPFFSTKEVGAGTGLGLATVYGIIKQTGGYTYVRSKPGVGTTFSIYLKALTSSEEEAVDTKAGIESANPAPSFFGASESGVPDDLTGNATLLLVEDEDPVRIFASRALANKGYRVLEASSAQEALDMLATHGKAIQLVISDVMMPGMNGPAMALKILEAFPSTKIIFISGYAEDVFAQTLPEGYKINFLSKPFTLKQLAARVKEILVSD